MNDYRDNSDYEYEYGTDYMDDIENEINSLKEELEELTSNNFDGGLDEDIANVQEEIENLEYRLKELAA